MCFRFFDALRPAGRYQGHLQEKHYLVHRMGLSAPAKDGLLNEHRAAIEGHDYCQDLPTSLDIDDIALCNVWATELVHPSALCKG